MFMVIEGIDGTGKTLVSKLLQQRLEGVLQRKTCYCRVPDGPIRTILLDRPKDTVIDDWTELLLFITSHRWVVMNRVIPALKRGEIVLLDRFTDSLIAYQGGGRELGVKTVERLVKEHILNDTYNHFDYPVQPDLTLYMQTSEETREARISRRDKLDHMDAQGLEFRKRCDYVMNRLSHLNELAFINNNSTMRVANIFNNGLVSDLAKDLDSFVDEHSDFMKKSLNSYAELNANLTEYSKET